MDSYECDLCFDNIDSGDLRNALYDFEAEVLDSYGDLGFVQAGSTVKEDYADYFLEQACGEFFIVVQLPVYDKNGEGATLRIPTVCCPKCGRVLKAN